MGYFNTFLNRLPIDYQELLAHRLDEPDWIKHLEHLQWCEENARREPHPLIYPRAEDVFQSLKLTPLKQIKVVLIGQDPYHSPGLAQGLAFSVPKEIVPGSKAFPSSLRNISKALALEGFSPLAHGDLSHWAGNGVLLLNTTLTVTQGLPNSHFSWGWRNFTDALIQDIFQVRSNLIAMLWGGFAQNKQALIPVDQNHLILNASHPSGLGVYKTAIPFLMPKDQGSCGHFTAANQWLIQHGIEPIAW